MWISLVQNNTFYVIITAPIVLSALGGDKDVLSLLNNPNLHLYAPLDLKDQVQRNRYIEISRLGWSEDQFDSKLEEIYQSMEITNTSV